MSFSTILSILGCGRRTVSPSPPAQEPAIFLAGSTVLTGQQQFAVLGYDDVGARFSGWGTGGLVTTTFNLASTVQGIVQQADGKVVAVGWIQQPTTLVFDFALARYNTDGSLDTGFGTGGVVTTDFGTSADEALAVAVQDDQKIVAAGYTRTGGTQYDFALARYNTDGSLDTGFGSGGKVTTDFGATTDDQAYAVIVQADQKIVAAGYTTVSGKKQFAVARYNTDGSLDTSGFGTSGLFKTSVSGTTNDQVFGLAIQSDQMIVATGFTLTSLNKASFETIRLTTAGALDSGFGTGGKVNTVIGVLNNDRAQSVTIDGSGNVVVGGWTSPSGLMDFALVRYDSSGALDTTFNGTGKVTTNLGSNGDKAFCLVIQDDGKIIAGGLTSTKFAMARYNNDGSLDSAFGASGLVIDSLSGSGFALLLYTPTVSLGSFLITGGFGGPTLITKGFGS